MAEQHMWSSRLTDPWSCFFFLSRSATHKSSNTVHANLSYYPSISASTIKIYVILCKRRTVTNTIKSTHVGNYKPPTYHRVYVGLTFLRFTYYLYSTQKLQIFNTFVMHWSNKFFSDTKLVISFTYASILI